MTCKHPRIETWNTRDGEPAGLWSCAECRQKFIPIQEMFDAVSEEREACAQVVDANVATCRLNSMLADVLAANAAAIRARGNP